MSIYFKDILGTRHEIKSENREEETLEHLKTVLVAQKILNPDEPYFLLYAGKRIESDEKLQQLMQKKVAVYDYDCIILMRKKLPIKHSSLMDIFQMQVKNKPNATAASFEGETFTYDEIDQKSTQLAHYLTNSCKVGPNIPVAIMGSDKLEMLICQLAILKTGSAFVPFTPDTPPERLEFTLNNCKADIILSCDGKSNQLLTKQNKPFVDVTKIREEVSSLPIDPIKLINSESTNLAYILYTSGSTSAEPKGVMQTREGLAGQIKNYTENLAITEKDHFLQLAPLTHDQSIVDIYGALLNGAELHFQSMNIETLDKNAIKDFIIDKKISIFSSIPSVFSLIFDDVRNDTSFPDLRIVTLGGEAVKKDHVTLFQQICSPDALFINGYGATECSWISYHVIKKDDIIPEQIPLGIMATGIDVYLDRDGQLWVSSGCMSPGYLNNQEANKAAFSMHHGKAFYKTGDLVTVDRNNVYHFNGRMAWHEKINGKRVNLKGIEDCMLKKYPFEECVVMSYGKEDNKKIIAFYQAKEKLNQTDQEIRKDLSDTLALHEIPYRFIKLDKFPLLENGKISHQKLKQIIQSDLQERQLIHKGIDEKAIVEKSFAEVLDLEEAPTDNFNFLVHGASSIDIAQISNKINVHLFPNINIEIKEIYNAQTIGNLKKVIDDKLELKEAKSRIPFYEFIPRYHYEFMGTKGAFYQDLDNKAFSFNFASMKILANFYNNLYSIKIIPCESQEDFRNQIENFIDNPSRSSIGLTLPRNSNVKDGHHTPCILEIDENKVWHLYISDSTGGLPLNPKDFKALLDYPFKKDVHFHVDLIDRQDDFDSCSTDLIVYLKNGLRLNMAKKIIPLPNSKDMPAKVSCFQSPPEILKAAQTLNSLKISIDDKEIKEGVTFKQHREKHTREATLVEYVPPPGNLKNIPPMKIEKNTYLFDKGKKFKEIIDKNS